MRGPWRVYLRLKGHRAADDGTAGGSEEEANSHCQEQIAKMATFASAERVMRDGVSHRRSFSSWWRWRARAFKSPAVRDLDEKRSFVKVPGAYAGDRCGSSTSSSGTSSAGSTSPPQLVAFDEDGLVRVLYPTGDDQFFAGPGRGSTIHRGADQVSARQHRQGHRSRRGSGRANLLPRGPAPRRKHEDVRFANGDVRLAGTLISPTTGGDHSRIILVHGSGAENREYILPFARFLVRRGMAVLGYDKRGVGGSTGDWKTASFDVLAGDVVAAFDYLKTRSDIDPARSDCWA